MKVAKLKMTLVFDAIVPVPDNTPVGPIPDELKTEIDKETQRQAKEELTSMGQLTSCDIIAEIVEV